MEEENKDLKYVIKRLQQFNNRIDKVIEEMLFGGYNKTTLENTLNSLQTVILGDSRIKDMLTNATPEQRKQYMDIIVETAKNAQERVTQELAQHDMFAANKAEITNLAKDANQQVFDVTSSIEQTEKEDFANIGSSQYKKAKEDYTRQIDTIDRVLAIEPKMSGAKSALVAAGKTGTTAEIVTEVETLETARKQYLTDVENCERVAGVNFKALVDNLEYLINDPGMDMRDEDVKKAVSELKKKCSQFDVAYEVGGARIPLGLSLAKTGLDLNRVSDAKLWIENLKKQINAPGNEFLSDPDNALFEFLKEKVETSQEQFSAKLDASVVLDKLLTPEEMNALKGNPKTSKTILENLKKSVEEYSRNMEGTNPHTRASLEAIRDALNKKVTAYTDIAMDKKALTIDGKTLNFENEMLDPNVTTREYYKYLNYIEGQTSDSGKEFKENFESMVTTAIGRPRPTNRWYHKLGEWITRGRYKSPETKYDIEYDEHAVTILKGAITDKKEKFEDATRVVGNDTTNYRKTVIRDTVEQKRQISRKERLNKAKDQTDYGVR